MKKNKVWEPTVPLFKIYYKSTVIKTLWYWYKDSDMDQWNRIEFKDRLTYICSVDFGKNIKAIWWEKDDFSTHVAGTIGFHMQKYDLWSILAVCTKMNSKWIIDLNIKPRIIKLLEERIGDYFCDPELGQDFSAMAPKEWSTEENDKLYYIKMKNFCFKR